MANHNLPKFDKIHVALVPEPPTGVWREITHPVPALDDLTVWTDHLIAKGNICKATKDHRGMVTLWAKKQ